MAQPRTAPLAAGAQRALLPDLGQQRQPALGRRPGPFLTRAALAPASSPGGGATASAQRLKGGASPQAPSSRGPGPLAALGKEHAPLPFPPLNTLQQAGLG